MKTPHVSNLKSFSNLPLGTRFRYPGSERVYTIIEQHRDNPGEPLSGVIAEWNPEMVAKTVAEFFPTDPHAGRWHGQQIYSHIPECLGGDCPDMVEAID